MKNNLCKYRKQLKIPQRVLADDIGISRVYLSNIENGKVKPSVEIAYKIATRLNKTVEEIFFLFLCIVSFF